MQKRAQFLLIITFLLLFSFVFVLNNIIKKLDIAYIPSKETYIAENMVQNIILNDSLLDTFNSSFYNMCNSIQMTCYYINNSTVLVKSKRYIIKRSIG